MNAPWSPELADQFNTDGFVVVDELIRSDLLEPLHARFEAMFRGEFETGIAPEMITCWIALDDTAASTGTVEFVRGSHRRPDEPSVDVAFHDPADYRIPVRGHEADIVPIEVRAGSGSFHHGWTWHGSGVNTGDRHRRALVIHAVAVGTRFDRARLTEGNGALYGHYCAPDDDTLPIEHFPILWTAGADSPGPTAQ